MSRIAIDIRALTDRHRTGVGIALEETLVHIMHSASLTQEFVLFATGSAETLARIPPLFKHPRVAIKKITIPNRLVLLFSLIHPRALDILLDEHVDGWWFPNWTIIATKKPYALTVHDASFVHAPHYYSCKHRALVAVAHPARAAQRALRCFSVSPHTSRDLHHTWKIPQSRIEETLLGVDHTQFCVREQPADRSYRAGYDLNKPYILSLATHEPRKNILGMLAAYQHARKQQRNLPPLVLAGLPKKRFPQKLLENVHLLGYIPAKHRPALFRGASVFLFPSFYEGFGLPVLEALACGIPTVTATSTAPTSLFSEGIFPADAFDVHDIARALLSAYSAPHDEHARKKRAEQTLRFSWEKTAERVISAFLRMT